MIQYLITLIMLVLPALHISCRLWRHKAIGWLFVLDRYDFMLLFVMRMSHSTPGTPYLMTGRIDNWKSFPGIGILHYGINLNYTEIKPCHTPV
ncbi:MAG: hypothetical protein JWM28_3480 [Chitinophagaceae bacterium]|nr:hypothetical protein [Chitinophagaceae bacterium]